MLTEVGEMDLLEVENLSVSFYRPEGEIEAVKNVSFSLREGEILAAMGEACRGERVWRERLL